MKLAKYSFTLLSILILAVNLIAQENSAPIEVKANVLVLDKDDKFIDDVKQEDIKIFEDGVEQKITYFAKKEPVLNVGLIVDNTGSMRGQLDRLIWAGKTITANLALSDKEFVVRFVDSEKIQVVQDWISPQVKCSKSSKNTESIRQFIR